MAAARGLLFAGAMPSFEHEAPLALLREQPAFAAGLLRDLLGVDVPAFGTARVTEADLSQLVPTELRADLVVRFDDGDDPVLGVIVEAQRGRDDRKRRSWPLYTAALHARLGCRTCLLVLARDARVAAWARVPIETLQPGSPFTPLVIGPPEIPRITSPEAALHAPELATLSALAHGNDPGGLPVVSAALDAAYLLGDHRGALYYDLIMGALNDAARRALEDEMQARKYEYRTEFARRYVAQGREEGREEGREQEHRAALATARDVLRELVRRRLGELPDAIDARIDACDDAKTLATWTVEVGSAPNADAVVAVFA